MSPFAQLSSLAVCVNPGSAFNCYWEMPFRKRCRITYTNLAPDALTLFYQINYTLTDVPAVSNGFEGDDAIARVARRRPVSAAAG